MPRSLDFILNGTEFSANIIKVDRSHLYGTVSIDTADMEGERCSVATLAVDGKTLIPKGGTAMGYVNPEGEWVSRDELNPVDLDGEPVDEVESSFDNPIELAKECSTEDFLDHSVRLVYRLKPETAFPDVLLSELKSGKVFQFGFSYRGGVGHDPAFVLCGDEDDVWMMVTTPNQVELVGLTQAAVCLGENQDLDDDENIDSSIDFGML